MRIFILQCFLIASILNGFAQGRYCELSPAQKKLYDEHIVMGQPDPKNAPVFVRHGYVMKYNNKYRIPEWVAYHIVPAYLKTPKREKNFSRFRFDPDIKTPVQDKDYTGSGYARGHMAPYFAMGGDRNGNGIFSSLISGKSDPYDDTTIYQANYLSNVAPQDQDALNGSGGPWYALETVIRDKLVRSAKMDLHVVVGGIVKDSVNYKTLKGSLGNAGIAIPDQFFQVLIYKNEQGKYITAAFLFPHVRKKSELPSKELIFYLVPVDTIEKLTGLDFLNKLSKEEQRKTESIDNKQFWTALMN